MNSIRPMTAVAALVTALVLGAGTAAVVTTALVDDDGPTTRQVTVTNAFPAASSSGGFTVNDVYAAAHESVLEIATTSDRPNDFGGEQQQLAQGSGWVYDRQGHVVTNQHVVHGATSVNVTFSNGA